MKKLIVIGDLVSSRKIANRDTVQKNLNAILKELNKTNNSILSPYTITLGDEFQGVLEKSSGVFPDFIAIMLNLYPVKIRFSLGIGSISTSINREMAIGMDGEAFHYGREGIEEIKKTGYYFNVKGISSEHSNLIRHSLFLISGQINKWNKNQLQIFYELNRDTKVKDISGILGITEQAIYKSINKEEMHLIREMLEEISDYINRNLK